MEALFQLAGDDVSNATTTSKACKEAAILVNVEGYLYLICVVTSVSCAK